jgi:hypothetical protein
MNYEEFKQEAYRTWIKNAKLEKLSIDEKKQLESFLHDVFMSAFDSGAYISAKILAKDFNLDLNFKEYFN